MFVLETEIVTGGDGERGDHSVALMDTDQENRVGSHREKEDIERALSLSKVPGISVL